MANNISEWFTSDASNNTGSAPNFPVEGQSPASVNDTMRTIYGAVARWYQDTNGTLATAGTSNAYVLTTNNSHAALGDTSFLIFQADRANTGAATLNVDGLGAKSLRMGGEALSGGELVADTVIIACYNDTDDAYDILGGANFGTLNITGTTATDLSNNNNPLNIGTESGAHLALDPNGVQAKSDATTATTLELNNLGGAVNIGAQSGSGHVSLYGAGAKRAETTSTGVDVIGNVLDLDNSAAATAAAVIARNSEGGVRLFTDAGDARLRQVDSDGSSNEEEWIVMTRNGSVALHHNGAAKLSTASGGADLTGRIQITQDFDTGVSLVRGAQNWDIYVDDATNDLIIRDVTNSETAIAARDNGAVELSHNGSTKVATSAAGATVTGTLNATTDVTVNGDSVVVQDWTNYSAMTVAPAGSDEFLFNDGGTIKTMSYNESALPSNTDSGAHTFVDSDVGTIRYYTGTGGDTWSMPSGVGQDNCYIVVVNSGSGSLTLAGSTATVSAANSLLTVPQNGTAVLIRESSTQWFASGSLQ